MTEQEFSPDTPEEEANPLMTNHCDTCAMTLLDCAQSSQGTLIDIIMVENAIKILPPDYKEVLERILIDWRTHALPTCDQSAID